MKRASLPSTVRQLTDLYSLTVHSQSPTSSLRCCSVAGSLMSIDEEGFLALERHADALAGAEKVMAFAKAMLRCAKTVTMPHNGQPTQVRVGLHTGPVVTGLIGTKLPKFSIFGTYGGSGEGTGERGLGGGRHPGQKRGAGEGSEGRNVRSIRTNAPLL